MNMLKFVLSSLCLLPVLVMAQTEVYPVAPTDVSVSKRVRVLGDTLRVKKFTDIASAKELQKACKFFFRMRYKFGYQPYTEVVVMDSVADKGELMAWKTYHYTDSELGAFYTVTKPTESVDKKKVKSIKEWLKKSPLMTLNPKDEKGKSESVLASYTGLEVEMVVDGKYNKITFDISKPDDTEFKKKVRKELNKICPMIKVEMTRFTRHFWPAKELSELERKSYPLPSAGDEEEFDF